MKKQLKKAIMKACLSELAERTAIETTSSRPFEGFSYIRKNWIDQDDEIEKVTLNTALSHLSSPANWNKTETFTMMPEWGTNPLKRSWVVRLPTHFENEERYLFHYFYQVTTRNGNERVSDTYTQMIVPKEVEYIDHSGDCDHVILHWSLDKWSYPQNTELEAEGISWGSDYSVSQAMFRSGIDVYEKGRTMELAKIAVPRTFKCKIWGPKGEAVDYCFKLIKNENTVVEWDNNAESDYRLVI